MTTGADLRRAPARPGQGAHGAKRAHLLSLFDHFVVINAKHVAACLGVSERIAGVMLSTAARDGRVQRIEYTIRRRDGVTMGYRRGKS